MEDQEWEDQVDCIDCGAAIRPDLDRTFALGDETFLCHACALARGGAYDGDRDRWEIAPSTNDEPGAVART
jgi:hypothetical protein